MKDTVRSEALRSVSGSSILAVYLVAVLMPVFVLFSDCLLYTSDAADE